MAVPGASDTAIFDLPFQVIPVPVQANNNVVNLLVIDHMRVSLNGSLQSNGIVMRNLANLSLTSGATLSLNGSAIIDNAGVALAGDGTRIDSLSAGIQIIHGGVVFVDQTAVLSAQNTVSGIELGSPGDLTGNILQVFRAGVVQTPVLHVKAGELLIANGGSVQAEDCTVFEGAIEVVGEGATSSRLDSGSLDLGGRLEPVVMRLGPSRMLIEGGGTVKSTVR